MIVGTIRPRSAPKARAIRPHPPHFYFYLAAPLTADKEELLILRQDSTIDGTEGFGETAFARLLEDVQ